MKPFDLYTAQLRGTQLIEASAGTGKTYTIAGLFLKLILTHDLLVEQILVVTFTNAATEELKERIYTKLSDARQGLKTGSSNDPQVQHVIRTTADRSKALKKLESALSDFDRAAILTIHGFCQRILVEHAFETGSRYDLELVGESSAMIQAVAEDFWRKYFYPAPEELIYYLRQEKNVSGPDYFYRLAGKINRPAINIIPLPERTELENLVPYRRLLHQVRQLWRQSGDDVLDLLRAADLDGRIYGTIDASASVSGRDRTLARLSESMHATVYGQMPGFPIFKEFDKLTTTTVRKYTRKKSPSPVHPFFDSCEQLAAAATALETQFEGYLLWLKAEFTRYFPNALTEKKNRARVRFYDDLLVDVHKALNNPQRRANELGDAIRNQYRAALVDEFQDTDALQYEIFNRLFGGPNHIFFMIGDPKQSIYSFRGADIFAYMHAASEADARSTLNFNWRSEPILLEALNTLFQFCRQPFLYPQIPYRQVDAAPQKPASGDPLPFKEPLEIWYLAASGPRPLNKTQAEQALVAATATEITSILTACDNPTGAEEVAVLVRTNRQARIVKSALTAAGIPAVLFRAGNVFDSIEAVEMSRLLTGIAAVSEERLFRAAVVTDLIGVSGDRMAAALMQTDWWEALHVRFQAYHRLWQRSGFVHMFRSLLVGENVRERLLSADDGPRRLTNVLHLAEILHQEASSRKLTMGGLLKWFTDQCNSQTIRQEAHELRLERDAQAVKIVTIHRSKGLEYPIVFCPFCWEGITTRREKEVYFHPDNGRNQIVLDLGSDNFDRHHRWSESETLAENLRLLYVAVTRAQKKCYLAWGRISSADTSALAYILHRPPDLTIKNAVAQLKASVGRQTDVEMLDVLKQLSSAARGRIKIRALPMEGKPARYEAVAVSRKLSCRTFAARIDRAWRITSYSAMISHQWNDTDWPGRNDGPTEKRSARPDGLAGSATAGRVGRKSIHRFPKGARAGIFFHSILQQLDFSNPDRSHLDDLVADHLRLYGFAADWQGVLCDNIRQMINVQLTASRPDLSFTRLKQIDRVNEMAFYFPLHPFSPKHLQKIFKRDDNKLFTPEFIDRLKTTSPVNDPGFMKGYVDLVFCFRNRYYIVDWKSNHLGTDTDSYRPVDLKRTMNQEMYILQYYLYTLAVNRFLQARHPTYDYERDFGGVFYIFLRGIDPEAGRSNGIFFDRPQLKRIEALDRLLTAG